jgi:ribosomal-protein-alanine N-acetyltransferase
MRVAVDRMREDDIADVLSVVSSSQGTGVSQDSQLTEQKLREELARPWARLWVARGDVGGVRRAVAFLLAWHVADELHVLDVATHADLRRRGIGRRLMDTAILYARDHRGKHILLEVRRSNTAAIHLYRACGFFAMGVRPRYYPDDEDAIEMVLLFDRETREIVKRKDEIAS